MRLPILKIAVFGSIAFALPTTAWAQEAPPSAVVEPAPVQTERTTSQATGPSMAMVGSGVGIFALSYLPAVVVGATSGLNADRALFVPIAGPWIDLTQRPGCAPGVSCNGEDTAKVFIVVDGVFQAIGALTIIGGFLSTAHETTTVRTADLRPTLHLTPAQMGQGGYGMQAIGTF
ncbi:MAG: hypothetical protein ACLP1X_34250 [Polyangiaceae bacterium]|jgi:hypothetical protein